MLVAVAECIQNVRKRTTMVVIASSTEIASVDDRWIQRLGRNPGHRLACQAESTPGFDFGWLEHGGRIRRREGKA